MKLCKDCKWCKPKEELIGYYCGEARKYESYADSTCKHANVISSVTGEAVERCEDVRDETLKCGRDGRWWEAK
jgi:hypothetical protein